MALDGFCSFVANLAVAARIHHQAAPGAPGAAPAVAPGAAPSALERLEIWIWIFVG